MRLNQMPAYAMLAPGGSEGSDGKKEASSAVDVPDFSDRFPFAGSLFSADGDRGA
jgi:hypothetical protein